MKTTFRLCLQATISLLFSATDMPDMRWIPFGGMNFKPEAILESFGSTKKDQNFTHSLTVHK